MRFVAPASIVHELVDRLDFAPRGSLAAVRGVGRLLRLLKAARIRPPERPYDLDENLDEAVRLVERCRGAEIGLLVRPRFERALTLWRETGVQRIERVVDFREDRESLSILTRGRRGGQTEQRIPRHELVRYVVSTSEVYEVAAVESTRITRTR